VKNPAKHKNRIPFEGLLTRLDAPSDKAPSGARGHRVILTTGAAEAALGSLIGMAVSFKAAWDGHDARQKCGVITEAFIEGDELRVAGHIYAHDFPDVFAQMSKPNVNLGMSYEMVDARVENMTSPIWTLTEVTFTGAAILLRNKAAYRSTRINLMAVASTSRGGRIKLQVEGGRVKLG